MLVRSALVVLFAVSSLSAQTAAASLSGYVTDPSGAVVTNAAVQVVNEETNVSQTTRSNDSGLYSFPSLPPGHYRMSVKAAGFKEFVKTSLILHVGDTVSEDFRMEVGATSESVTVSAEALAVNTEDPTVATVGDRQAVEDSPLARRRFQGLSALSPGVATVAVGSGAST